MSDEYGDPNDLAPDVKAPRDPRGEPTMETDEYEVYTFESDQSAVVPDTYIVEKDPEGIDFRMWIFAGSGPFAVFYKRSSHKYAEDDPDPGHDCCEVLVQGQSLREHHCPDDVQQLVIKVTDAPVALPNPEDEE